MPYQVVLLCSVFPNTLYHKNSFIGLPENVFQNEKVIEMSSRYWQQFTTALRVTFGHLGEPKYLIRSLIFFYVIMTLLQWLFQLQLLLDVLRNSALSVTDKIDFMLDSFRAVFSDLGDLTPISFIVISFCLSAGLSMLISIGSNSKKQGTSSIVIGLLGSGCVACGGSLLSPVVSIFASGGSAVVSSFIIRTTGDVLLIVAMIFSIKSLIDISQQYARVVGR